MSGVRTECESSSILGLTFKKSCFETNFNKYILIISSAREIKLDSKFIPQTRESVESAKECFEYESFEYEPRLDPSLPIAASLRVNSPGRKEGRGGKPLPVGHYPKWFLCWFEPNAHTCILLHWPNQGRAGKSGEWRMARKRTNKQTLISLFYLRR